MTKDFIKIHMRGNTPGETRCYLLGPVNLNWT